jgi:hypothetical protein
MLPTFVCCRVAKSRDKLFLGKNFNHFYCFRGFHSTIDYFLISLSIQFGHFYMLTNDCFHVGWQQRQMKQFRTGKIFPPICLAEKSQARKLKFQFALKTCFIMANLQTDPVDAAQP